MISRFPTHWTLKRLAYFFALKNLNILPCDRLLPEKIPSFPGKMTTLLLAVPGHMTNAMALNFLNITWMQLKKIDSPASSTNTNSGGMECTKVANITATSNNTIRINFLVGIRHRTRIRYYMRLGSCLLGIIDLAGLRCVCPGNIINIPLFAIFNGLSFSLIPSVFLSFSFFEI